MTIILELTAEQEDRLSKKAGELGLRPEEFLIRTIDELKPSETTGQRMRRLGRLGGAAGTARADGRPWSEIEGFE